MFFVDALRSRSGHYVVLSTDDLDWVWMINFYFSDVFGWMDGVDMVAPAPASMPLQYEGDTYRIPDFAEYVDKPFTPLDI